MRWAGDSLLSGFCAALGIVFENKSLSAREVVGSRSSLISIGEHVGLALNFSQCPVRSSSTGPSSFLDNSSASPTCSLIEMDVEREQGVPTH